MQEIRLSASSINDFRACPYRYLLNYNYGLQPKKEKDSTRIGSIWHRCHEILEMIPQGKCPACLKREEIREDCYLCLGTGVLPVDLMDAVVRYLNYKYKIVPDNKTYDDWQVERIKILYSLSGYRWNYPDVTKRFQSIASELKFDLSVLNPLTNKKLGKARIVGKIDELVQDRETGLYYIRERKSTSQSLEGDKYWKKLAKDLQVTNYLYIARRAQLLGYLEKFGVMQDEPLIQGVWWDAWHKPQIAPRKLTKKEIILLENEATYFGEEFRAKIGQISAPTFETPEMFGARLLNDIATRPEFYFQQREVSRTDEQLEQFEHELMKMVQVIRTFKDKDLWYCNYNHCESPFYCDFRDICNQDIVIRPEDCPEGFRKYVREEKN